MVQRLHTARLDMTPTMSPKPAMPSIYKYLLTASSLVFLVYAIEDGRGPTWGPIEQVSMGVAGVLVMWVAWHPNRKLNVFAAYAATIAVLFEVAAMILDGRGPWRTAVAIWLVFGAYTVLLTSFSWIREPK